MNERSKKPDGEHWIPVSVQLLDKQTGERRTYATWGTETDGHFDDFIWDEGNFACDCNRYLFFQYANGVASEDIPNKDGRCGNDRFVVEAIIDARTEHVRYSELVATV